MLVPRVGSHRSLWQTGLHGDSVPPRETGVAVAGSAENPFPPEGFHRGAYHGLRVGPYRVVYIVDDDALITAGRLGRVTDS
jgi:hypothetical protein